MSIRTLDEALTGRRAPTIQFEGLREAIVERVSGDDLWVRLLDQPRVEYGPVRWQRPVTDFELSDIHEGHWKPDRDFIDSTVTTTASGHTHTVWGATLREDPPRGTRCLVSFVGSGADRPWLVTFHGWPRP